MGRDLLFSRTKRLEEINILNTDGKDDGKIVKLIGDNVTKQAIEIMEIKQACISIYNLKQEKHAILLMIY